MPTVAEVANAIKSEIGKAIVGQDDVVEQALVCVFAPGHGLIESVPGLAKTLLVKSLALTMNLQFRRIQFTPDLMPSDVVGTNVFDAKESDFRLRKGPIFTSVLLADEINRTPPKTQAALLEAMEEGHVTIDGETLALPKPFYVFATQNPIEHEGTYPLPEAQQDRFLLKIVMDYPSDANEIEVLQRFNAGFRASDLQAAGIQPVVDTEVLADIRKQVNAVQVEEHIFRYVYSLVAATRNNAQLDYGASPRAGLALISCSKAIAAIRGRDYITPDDVKSLALPVLRHRVLLRPEAEIEGLTAEDVVRSIAAEQVVPR